MTITALLPRPYRYGDHLARMRAEWPDECSDYGSDADDELGLMDETTHRRDTERTRPMTGKEISGHRQRCDELWSGRDS